MGAELLLSTYAPHERGAGNKRPWKSDSGGSLAAQLPRVYARMRPSFLTRIGTGLGNRRGVPYFAGCTMIRVL